MKSGFATRLRGSIYKRASIADHAISAVFCTSNGLNKTPRARELIVSLTTIPERVAKIHLTIDCLLRQSVKPDRLILWLNECDVAGRPVVNPNTLPDSLRRLEKRGLSIEWCENIGPYCKLIPALKKYPNALIATADDDVLYPGDWLKKLYEAFLREPRYIHCHRAHKMRFDDAGELLPYKQWDYFAPDFAGPSPLLFPTGVGGVLYASELLHSDTTNESIFLKLCPKADDVWLKAMSAMQGVSCKKVSADSMPLYSIRIRNDRRLMNDNVSCEGNDSQIRNVMEHYKGFAEFLKSPAQ